MKSASPALQALLASDTFLMADLYAFSFVNGTTLYYTDADIDLSYNGHTYVATRISRGGYSLVIGTQVDNMNITISAGQSDLVGSVPWPQFVSAGGLDGARVNVSRVFMASFGDTSAGAVPIFEGRVSEVRPSRGAVEITVASDLELLNIQIPRNVYQSTCLNTLFDPVCGVSKAGAARYGAVQSGSTAQVIATDVLEVAGYFDLGTITFATGALAGMTRTVRTFDASRNITVLDALPSAPAAGDFFNVYPGCDKLYKTCRDKFNNLPRFRGFPFIPPPENAI